MKRKDVVDDEVVAALCTGSRAWEQFGRLNVEDWYRNENLTLQLANAVMLDFSSLTQRGSEELLEVYNHLVDFAKQLKLGKQVKEIADLFFLDVEIPHRVSSDELLLLAASEKSKKGIDKILQEHLGCFTGEACNRCKVVDEMLGEDLLCELARNPNTNEEQQEQLIELSHNRQLIYTILVSNPGVSKGARFILTRGEFWQDMEEEDVTQIIETMQENPRFTDSEIAEFRSYFEDEWGYGQ